MTEQEVRRDVYMAIRKMASRPDVFDGSHGNVAAAIDEQSFIIKPSGMEFAHIEMDDLVKVVCDKSGLLFTEGSRKPSVDTNAYIKLFSKYETAAAFCHMHSTYVVAHAVCGRQVECLTTEQSDIFGGPISCTRYITQDISDLTTASLRIPGAVLLAHHGGLTGSTKSALDAVTLAVSLEMVCKKNFFAYQLGTRVEPIEKILVDGWHRRFTTSYGQ